MYKIFKWICFPSEILMVFMWAKERATKKLNLTLYLLTKADFLPLVFAPLQISQRFSCTTLHASTFLFCKTAPGISSSVKIKPSSLVSESLLSFAMDAILISVQPNNPCMLCDRSFSPRPFFVLLPANFFVYFPNFRQRCTITEPTRTLFFKGRKTLSDG